MNQPESRSGETLKPCPFCGSSAVLTSKRETYGHGDYGIEWFVSCAAKACGVKVPSPIVYTASEDEQKRLAAESWNRRTTQPSETREPRGWYPAPKYWRPTGHSYVTFSSPFIKGIYTTIGGERYVLDMPEIPAPDVVSNRQKGEV